MKRTAGFAALLLLPYLFAAQGDLEGLHKLFAEVHETRVREHPEFGTSIGRTEYNDRWTDWSGMARERRKNQQQDWLKRLAAFPPASMTEQDRISARVLRYMLEDSLAVEPLEAYLLRLTPLFGLHNSVFMTIDRMPHRTVRDYENLIGRLRALPGYIDQGIAMLAEGAAGGITQPRAVVERVLQQVAGQAAQDENASPLLAAFRDFPSTIPQQQRDALRQQAAAAYKRDFLPSWKKLQAFLAGPYLAKARPGAGLGTIPGEGQRDYSLMVRSSTTTSLTPEEIHALGQQEVERLEQEMLAVARAAGFTGTLTEFYRKLSDSPEQHFRDKEEMLAWSRNVAKIIEPELPNLFQRIPILLYGVRAIPEDQEQSLATHAIAAPPGGTAPGWFELNTYEPRKQVRYDKEALVLHEAVPGHLFQIAVARGLTGLPEFRKFYGNGAYIEGWALYAESLGAKLGVYRTPESRFGQLASERFRAVRLVVDTGIHAKGWTREQALDYFRQHAPEAAVAEIDRYISWPGQALAYKIGQLKILEMRRLAEKELGPRFDIREFHDVVLRNGALPLEVLEEQVRGYIANSAALRVSSP